MIRYKFCGSCALRSQDGLHCALFGHEIDPQSDFCSRHNQSPHKCEICGNFIIDNSNSVLDFDENSNVHEICQKCRAALGTCATCGFRTTCEFETNSSPIQKVVVKQIRQGNMIAQTQVRNPERVKITCENGCGCWKNGHCCKEDNLCDNYKHIY